LVWDLDDEAIDGGNLIWMVMTNKGWAHLRGTVRTRDDGAELPFRADLFSAAAVGAMGPDRVAIRIYPLDADPNIDSPIHKVQGWIEGGSVQLGAGP
jgi:hypothetical protein